MSVLIQLNRSRSQFPIDDIMDEIIRYVLYHRRQVPVVVSALLNEMEPDEYRDINANLIQLLLNTRPSKIDKFRHGFTGVRNSLQRLMGSTNGKEVRRVAVIIGSSPSAPVDLYMVEFEWELRMGMEIQASSDPMVMDDDEPLPLLELGMEPFQPSKTKLDRIPLHPLKMEPGPLSKMERRQITRQLIDQGVCYRRGDSDFKAITKAANTFLLIQADRSTVPIGFVPRPDLDLMRYCTGKAKNVNWTILQLGTMNEDGKGEKEDREDLVWYQAEETVVGFDE